MEHRSTLQIKIGERKTATTTPMAVPGLVLRTQAGACMQRVLLEETFASMSDMLFHVYYLYSKSRKKLRELDDVVSDLKEVFKFSEGGNIRILSQGSH